MEQCIIFTYTQTKKNTLNKNNKNDNELST